MEMRSLYPVYLPVENTDEHDAPSAELSLRRRAE